MLSILMNHLKIVKVSNSLVLLLGTLLLTTACGKGFKATDGSTGSSSTGGPSVSPTPSPNPSPAPSPVPSPVPTPSPAPSPATSPVPSPVPSPTPTPVPSPSPTPVWSINYPTADTIELTEGSGSLDLKTTLPEPYRSNPIGTFTVDPTGSALPNGMTLSTNGMLSVGSAAAGATMNGVKFIYTEN